VFSFGFPNLYSSVAFCQLFFTIKIRLDSIRYKQLNKQLNDIALLNKSSQSYGATLAIWYHTVLPAARHK